MRVLITGGGGFLGSHLVERVRGERALRASTPFWAGVERTIAWTEAT